MRVRTQSAVAETAGLCLLIAEHIEATHRPLIRVHELVADFTRDADGRWWLLQVKAIVTTPAVGSGVIPGSPNALRRPSTAPPRPPPASEDAPPPSERPTATHTVCCRCCGRRNPPAALAQTLTQRMIRSMRAHQRARGVVLSWHRHFTSPEEMPDRPGRPSDKVDDKYSRLRVCAVCYDLYKAETKLEKAARGLAQRLGVTPDSSEGQVCSARAIHPCGLSCVCSGNLKQRPCVQAGVEWLKMAAARADQEVTAAGEECGESAGVEEASKHAPLSPG